MRHSGRLWTLAVTAVVAVVATVVPAAPAGADAGSDAAGFVARINQARAAVGAQALRVDPELTGIAQAWAQRMADAGGISHNPNFTTSVRAHWHKLGENVGMGGSVDSLHQAFMASPHHHENIVDPAFTRIGVGVVEKGGTIYTVHDFEVTFEDAAPARTPAAKPAAPARRVAPPAPKPAPARRPKPVAAAAEPATPTPTPAPAPPPPAPVAHPQPAGPVRTLPSVLTDLRLLDGRS